MGYAMNRAELGRSGVLVTRLGLGCAQLGNLYRELSDVDARQMVDAAWDNGIRYFDTAPHYGIGLSERRLGAALADRPRDEFVLSTKVGRLLVPSGSGGDDLAAGFAVPATHRRVWDFSADGVRRSLDSSLNRLGLDRVDVVYLHDPDEHWEIAVSQAYPALAALRAQGSVGAIGVGMNQWPMLARFVRETDVDVVMLAGRYTLLEPADAVALLDLCQERGTSVVAAAVFNSGILAHDTVPDTANYDYAAAPTELLSRARRFAEVCARYGARLPQAALHFPLEHPAVASVVVGAHSAEQVGQNAAALAAPVPTELWRELAAAGLLPADSGAADAS